MHQALVTFSKGVAAAELWAYGEERLAEVVLAFTDDELVSAWKTASTYNDVNYPLPVQRRNPSNGQVVCFACMNQVEGELRPLSRTRRRPDKKLPPNLRAASDEPAPDTHSLMGDDWTA